jgi:hypothetical protein
MEVGAGYEMDKQYVDYLIVSYVNLWLTEINRFIPCKPDVVTQSPYFHN